MLARGGATLQVFDDGQGFPVIFQHGLGGDIGQTRLNMPPATGFRLLTVECRAHGGSTAGEARPFSIAMFAEDVLAAIDQAGIGRFAIGGISMGAAIALRIAAAHPARVAGLALVRPAWLFDPAPENMRPFAEIAETLRAYPPEAGRAVFASSATGRFLAENAPDNLASLLGFFARRAPLVTADLLADVAADGPGVAASAAAALAMPIVVVGCAQDYIHPRAYAETLAEATGGRFVEVVAKAAEPERHFAEVRVVLGSFFETLPLDPRITTMADRNITALPRDRLLGEFSLWSADLGNLASDLKRTEPHADVFHIDVADGRFAPGFLFFPDLVSRIRMLTDRPLHVHLMVESDIVVAQARQFADAGADLISVHAENGAAAHKAVAVIQDAGCAAGVVLRLETPVEQVDNFIDKVSFVTLLGTAIGVKGQTLSPLARPRLVQARGLIRKHGRESAIHLAADGGIRQETVPILRAAGADTVVLGSLAFGDRDLAARIAWLHALPVG
jgi:ribulose-phosphate 3-epimerase